MRGHGALIVALCLLAGCQRESTVTREQLHVFGSIAQIEIRGVSHARAERALAEISARLRQREREWHPWEPSDLTRINAALRNGQPVQAPDSIIAMLRRAKDFAIDSDGLLDPAIGGLVEMWGFHTSHYPVATPAPTQQQIDRWLQQRPRIAEVHIQGHRLETANRAVQLDFNAIAEGVAAEEMAAILQKHGIEHALINMGGDVLALGDGDGKPWEVGMKDPFGDALGWVDLTGHEALFSSGDYNKFRQTRQGERWGHILDPRTGLPAHQAAATVVLNGDPVLADAAATALMVAGPSGFERLVTRMQLGCALMLTEKNQLLITRAMKSRTHFLREPAAFGPALDAGNNCGVR